MKYILKKRLYTVALVGSIGLSGILLKQNANLKDTNEQLLENLNDFETKNADLEQEIVKLTKENDKYLNYSKLIRYENKENFYIDDLKIMLINADGKMKYRFVYESVIDTTTKDNENVVISDSIYKSITEPDLVFENKSYKKYDDDLQKYILYNSTSEIYYGYFTGMIPDNNLDHVLVSYDGLPIKFDKEKNYSVEELKKMEEQLDNYQYMAENYNSEKSYDVDKLFAVEVNGKYFIGTTENVIRISLASNIDDENTALIYDYVCGITHPELALKLDLAVNYAFYLKQLENGENPVQNRFVKEVVSLDIYSEFLNESFNVINGPDLIKNQKSLSYAEIVKLENELNNSMSLK